ncbi:hypothetical protein MUP65_00670, partial [Patescibacteria group bacterium]|nr:hypothetical protein [Patescibacteria group bacterium]
AKKGLYVFPYGFLYSVAESDFAFEIISKESADNHPELRVEYHLPPEPTANPTPEPAPEATPEPTPEVSPAQDEPETNSAEQIIIAPMENGETEPGEKTATPSFPIETKDLIIGAICVVLALLAGATFSFAFMKNKKKDNKKKTEEESEE